MCRRNLCRKGSTTPDLDLDLDLNHCRRWWPFPFEVQRWPPDSRCWRQEAGSRALPPSTPPLGLHLTLKANLTGKGRPRWDTRAAAWSFQRVQPPKPTSSPSSLSGCWTSAHRGLAGAWAGLFGCPHPSRKGTPALSITKLTQNLPRLGTHSPILKAESAGPGSVSFQRNGPAPPAATGPLVPAVAAQGWPATRSRRPQEACPPTPAPGQPREAPSHGAGLFGAASPASTARLETNGTEWQPQCRTNAPTSTAQAGSACCSRIPV